MTSLVDPRATMARMPDRHPRIAPRFGHDYDVTAEASAADAMARLEQRTQGRRAATPV
jgi:hypothetical protein